MIPGKFDYVAAGSIDEALSLLRQHGDGAKLLAGGHSLVPLMKLRLAQPEVLIDISRLPGLGEIRQANGGLAIGATATYRQIVESSAVRESAPLLAQAAAGIGDPQVRNRGTIGGNLAHADTASDLPAVALALDAELVARGPNGERTIRASDFFRGMFATALAPDELLTEIRLRPLARGSGAAYRKFDQPASRYAIVGVAAVARLDGGRIADVAVAVTGAGERPARAAAAERALRGQAASEESIGRAAEAAAEGIEFLGDIHASADYRRHLVRVYTRRALQDAVRAAGG
jgi:carbon-monoxide dehydrogenase medium subunit